MFDLAEAELMGEFDKFIESGKALSLNDGFTFTLVKSLATLSIEVGNGDIVVSTMELKTKRNHIHSLIKDTVTIKKVSK